MKKYLLKLGGCKVENRVYPVAKGDLVKDKEYLFNKEGLEDEFYPDNVSFDYFYLKNSEENYWHQKPWILVDIHDLVSPRPNGGGILFLVSPKFKHLFENFDNNLSKFYPAKLLFEGNHHDYFIWHSKRNEYLNLIDWEKSNFTEWNVMRTRKRGNKYYNFSSKDDFIESVNNIYNLGFEKAIFKKSFQENDLCFFPKVFPGYTFIISERLKQAIESAGIEGVVIKELPFEIEYSDQLND